MFLPCSTQHSYVSPTVKILTLQKHSKASDILFHYKALDLNVSQFFFFNFIFGVLGLFLSLSLFIVVLAVFSLFPKNIPGWSERTTCVKQVAFKTVDTFV